MTIEERLKEIEEELEHHMMGSYLTKVIREELLPYIRELKEDCETMANSKLRGLLCPHCND